MASIDENRAVWYRNHDWSHQGGMSAPGPVRRRSGAGPLAAPDPRLFARGHRIGDRSRLRPLDTLPEGGLRPADRGRHSARCIGPRSSGSRAPRTSPTTTNDGKSLAMVPDGSVDFAFSADSLVHAEADALEAYVHELARTLSPDGVAFIHHSNLGAYRRYFSWTTRIPRMSRRKYLLVRAGVVDPDHWRALSMSARSFASFAGRRLQGTPDIINWAAPVA